MCLLPAIVSFARALSYLASPSPVCLFVALIGQQWQQQRVRSCGTSGLTATTANLTLAIPAFDTSPPPFSHINLTKALNSHYLAPALGPHPVLAALLCKKGGSRVAVLGLLAGGTVEPAAPVSGLHWEATPPHTRLCEAARASQRREGGRAASHRCANPNPPPPNSTQTHHHPIKLKPNAIHPALANPNPQTFNITHFHPKISPRRININITQEKLPGTPLSDPCTDPNLKLGLKFT